MFSALSVLALQGSITVLSSYAINFLTDSFVRDLTATGGILVLAIAANLPGFERIRAGKSTTISASGRFVQHLPYIVNWLIGGAYCGGSCMDVITADRMSRIEDKAEALGISRLLMMENAGGAVAHFVVERFSPLSNKRVVIICGTGNNGGDGLVCLRHLAGLPLRMEAFLLGTREQVKTIEARTNLEIILHMKSIRFYDVDTEDFSGRISDSVGKADVIVDAIFGTGVKSGIREPQASVIEMMNASKAFKVAVDIPSGLDPNTGKVLGQAARANATITFHKMKKGLLGNQDFTGELVVVPIGVPPDAELG